MRFLTLNNFYVFVFLIILTSCSTETEEVFEGSLLERQGLLYKVNTDTPFTGLSVSYYLNTQYLSKQYIEDGKKHGLFEVFYHNGQLEHRGNYKDGKKHGLFEEFYGNGQVKIRENYKDGKKHGLLEVFYKHGQLRRKENYKDGKKL